MRGFAVTLSCRSLAVRTKGLEGRRNCPLPLKGGKANGFSTLKTLRRILRPLWKNQIPQYSDYLTICWYFGKFFPKHLQPSPNVILDGGWRGMSWYAPSRPHLHFRSSGTTGTLQLMRSGVLAPPHSRKVGLTVFKELNWTYVQFCMLIVEYQRYSLMLTVFPIFHLSKRFKWDDKLLEVRRLLICHNKVYMR